MLCQKKKTYFGVIEYVHNNLRSNDKLECKQSCVQLTVEYTYVDFWAFARVLSESS